MTAARHETIQGDYRIADGRNGTAVVERFVDEPGRSWVPLRSFAHHYAAMDWLEEVLSRQAELLAGDPR